MTTSTLILNAFAGITCTCHPNVYYVLLFKLFMWCSNLSSVTCYPISHDWNRVCFSFERKIVSSCYTTFLFHFIATLDFTFLHWSLNKRFLKRNLADVGMAQWMQSTQTRNATQWYALHNMRGHVHIIQQPYIINLLLTWFLNSGHPYIWASQ